MPLISSVRAAGYSLQPGHYSNLPAPNLQPTANQERNDQCGNNIIVASSWWWA